MLVLPEINFLHLILPVTLLLLGGWMTPTPSQGPPIPQGGGGMMGYDHDHGRGGGGGTRNLEHIWMVPKILVVGFPPKSSILIGFSVIFTIHFGVPLFVGNTYISHKIMNHLGRGSILRRDPSVQGNKHKTIYMDWNYKMKKRRCKVGLHTSYTWSPYNPFKWPCKWVTGTIYVELLSYL